MEKKLKQRIEEYYYSTYRRFCPTKLYLDRMYYQKFGKHIDWKNPKTFNEKLQWLKVYDHNPLYTQLVDKYEVRKYVADKIGEEYLIPCLGVWDAFEDIDFDTLPDQFVLKCTHDSNSVVICYDKSSFDIQKAREKLNSHLKQNFYYNCREWPYKNVKPRIIAEKFMTDESGVELKDYKVFNFNGQPRFIHVDSGRFTDHKRNLYTCDWEYINASISYPNSDCTIIPKPQKLTEMLDMAKILSTGIPFVRTDFYSIKDRILFGEITFYPGAGFQVIKPESFGIKIGDYIKL